MNVAFFIQNSRAGGVDTFLINLIKFWPDKKDRLILICNKNHPGLRRIKFLCEKKIKIIKYDLILSSFIYKLGNSYLVFRIIKKFMRYLSFFLSLNFTKQKFIKIFKDNQIERLLVINGGYHGGEACIAASMAWSNISEGKDNWHCFHNYATPSRGGIHFFDDIIKNYIDRKLSKAITGFVSVSNSCLKSLSHRRFLKVKKKIVIHNGISKITYKKIKNPLTDLKVKYSAKKILLMLATYEERKGYDFIFECMDRIVKIDPYIHLVVFGYGLDDEYKSILEKRNNRISKNNIHIYKYFNDISTLIRSSDVVVVPSQYMESFSYVALESMFYRKPVVATKIGGLKEVIKNNFTGYLCEKRNSYEFSNKILSILKSKKKSNFFSINGYRRYKKYFTSKKMANKYYNILR